MHIRSWGWFVLWILLTRCTTTAMSPSPSATTKPAATLAPERFAAPTATQTVPATPVPSVELWLLTPTIPPTELPSAVATSPFRPPEFDFPAPVIPEPLGVNIHFTQPEEGELSRLRALGVRWVRKDFFWGEVEYERGQYDFSEYDALFAMLQANGLHPLFILDYGNALYDGGTSPHTDEGRSAFARFAAAAAGHYRGEAIVWEIWNEPNLALFWSPQPNATDYGKLVRTTASAIHRADPSALVIAPAVVGFPWDFWRTIGQLGSLHYLNAVSVHPYGLIRPEDVQPHYRTLRRLLTQLNPTWDLPIIASESGYSSLIGGITERTQAAYLIRYWLVGMSNDIPLNIWYDWRNNGNNPSESEENFGLLRHDLTPKPAYQAAQIWVNTLNGYQFMRRLPQLRAGDYVLLFQRNESLALVAWTIHNTHTITLPLPTTTITLVTMNGQSIPIDIVEHRQPFTLTSEPCYLLLPKAPSTQRLGSWRPTTTLQVLHPQHLGVKVSESNPFPEPRTATIEVWDGTQRIGATTETLPPGEKRMIWVPIVPPETITKERPLVIQLLTPDTFFPTLQQAMIWIIQP